MGEHPAGRERVILSATLDRFFAQYFARHPVTATFTGVHEYDDRLPDWSAVARQQDMSEMRALHADLSAHHPLPAGGMGELRANATLLDAELARANLDVRMAECESGHFQERNPALWTGEAIFGAVSLMIRPFAPVDARVSSLRRRLAAIPAFLAEMRSVIDGPVPATWRLRAIKECEAARQLFSDGLRQWCASAGTHDVATSAEAAAARDAFAECATWLAERNVAHDGAYSCGEGLLHTLLRRGHFSESSPRALLSEAMAAMEEESARLTQALAPYGGSWSAAQAAMSDERCAMQEYYGAFEQRWREIRDGVTARDVITWPDWPIRYVPIPAWARVAAPQLYWLFYRSPAPCDAYTTHEYVVTPIDDNMAPDVQDARLAAWNRSVITLNHVVHHGGLGHHVQNWNAIHRSRTRVGVIAAVDAASRIGMFLGGSMAEGWACYATGLAGELDLLSPLEQLSEQHTRVRLLARAIVDLHLHLGDWTFDECARYYMTHAGMSTDVALGETTKNSMFPATALMYWLGTKGILDLRSQQQRTKGSSFSHRAFHDELLSRGSIPVLLVSQLMSSR